jgi:16S rRNA (cytosine1402-N4)-methyltransferase
MSGIHIPVMLQPSIDALCGPLADQGQSLTIVDGTFGGGGYTRALLDALPNCKVIGIDRDPQAAERAQAVLADYPERFTFLAGRFGDMDHLVTGNGFEAVDGVVLDVGVSSYQIDQAERGFSFMRQGPLDMRMEQAGRSAADVVNETEADALADIIYHYGEERQSRRIARAIVAHREENGPFATTADLANVVRRVVRKSKDGIDPATRTFQGLRIFVNDEIGELRRGLAAAERILRPGGRLVVVSFHSLEDREVKAFMRDRAASSGAGGRLLPGETAGPAPTFSLVTRKAIAASAEEARQNPRARSAKLRAAERLDQPARTDLPQTTVVGGGL